MNSVSLLDYLRKTKIIYKNCFFHGKPLNVFITVHLIGNCTVELKQLKEQPEVCYTHYY